MKYQVCLKFLRMCKLRVSSRALQVTINATDGADPPLDGWCTFRVEVEDINDNTPVFDRNEYTADITSDTQQNHPILTVRAYDSDIGVNGEIEYSLLDDAGIFEIIGANGVIFLKDGLLGVSWTWSVVFWFLLSLVSVVLLYLTVCV